MKKRIATVLSLLLFCLCLAPAASAAQPISAGLDALRDQFVFGVGPETNGITMDYYAYEPDTGFASVKQPLVVWLHGLVSGGYPGRQITKNDISYWSSDEFQSRFFGGGAFILAPRSPEVVADWEDRYMQPLKELIDDYILQHKDRIDPTRIYLGGLSMGGKMTLKLAAKYPDMFAALFPCSPYFKLTDSVAAGVKDIPIWQMSSKTDCYMNYNMWIAPDWQKLMKANNRRTDCRITIFETALKPDGSRPGTTHDTWYAATYDMFMYDNEPFTGSVTLDGNGDEVTLTYPKGLIDWLCHYTSSYGLSESERSGITSWIYRVYTYFVNVWAQIVKALGLKGVLG